MTERIRRELGQDRQLRSGRWQARWKLSGVWYTARRDSDGGPMTFTTECKAADHLTWMRREIKAGALAATGRGPVHHAPQRRQVPVTGAVG